MNGVGYNIMTLNSNWVVGVCMVSSGWDLDLIFAWFDAQTHSFSVILVLEMCNSNNNNVMGWCQVNHTIKGISVTSEYLLLEQRKDNIKLVCSN